MSAHGYSLSIHWMISYTFLKYKEKHSCILWRGSMETMVGNVGSTIIDFSYKSIKKKLYSTVNQIRKTINWNTTYKIGYRFCLEVEEDIFFLTSNNVPEAESWELRLYNLFSSLSRKQLDKKYYVSIFQQHKMLDQVFV